jgi:hypothetical protein
MLVSSATRIRDIRARNADADPEEIQRIVDEAVQDVRAEQRTNGKADRSFNAWEAYKFTVLTCAAQLDELRATLRKPQGSPS